MIFDSRMNSEHTCSTVLIATVTVARMIKMQVANWLYEIRFFSFFLLLYFIPRRSFRTFQNIYWFWLFKKKKKLANDFDFAFYIHNTIKLQLRQCVVDRNLMNCQNELVNTIRKYGFYDRHKHPFLTH